jgi:uncharacterized GH25 family protein
MLNLKKVLSMGIFCVSLLFSINASAHYMWLNVNDYTPAEDRIAMFTIGWGHHFYNPVADILHGKDRVGETYLIDPDGKKKEIESVNESQYESADKLSAGTWTAMVHRKEGFSTKTTDGYKYQSKKGLKNVIYSRYLGMYGKAIINSGKSSKDDSALKPVGVALELVPTVNPANLKEGDYFTFKLLFKGKPIAEPVYATYVGFSTDDAWAYSSRTDAKGEGKIKILKSGIWVIKTNHKAPYPNQEEADEYSFTTSLTFEIK